MLNNLKYWLHNFVFTNTVPSYTGAHSLNKPFTDVDGNNIATSYSVSAYRFQLLGAILNNSADTGVKIHLGTGNTVKTTDETYCFENDVTSNFVLGNVTSAVDYPNGKVQLVLTSQYTNNTDEDITINEIGIVHFNHRLIQGTSYIDRILLDRKSVVDGNFTPVTVSPGESKIFVYAIEL